MESNFSNTDAVAALSSDDPDAFRALVEHYQHALFGFLGRMGFAQADAEDIAQDVFIKLWHSRARYNADTAQVSTWLFTIARNAAVNKLKRVSCKQIPFHEVEIEAENRYQPDQLLLQQSQSQRLSIAIQKLPIDDRSAIALFYIDELSIAQAASILDCNPNAFKTRLSRARNKLSIIIRKLEGTQ